jgi:hypothetical protein
MTFTVSRAKARRRRVYGLGDQVYVEAGRTYLKTPGLTPAHMEMMTTTFAPPLTA